jgi:hypothetical protein
MPCDERQAMKLYYFKKKLQIYNAFGGEEVIQYSFELNYIGAYY